MANVLSLTQTLPETALDASALGPRQLNVTLTLDATVASGAANLGRVTNAKNWLGEAKASASVTLGPPPAVPILPPRIYNLTGPVRDSGGAILCFIGPPWKTVEWRILEGTGTLTPFTTYTDELGRASCRFDAGYHGHRTRVVVGVAYVP